MPKETIYSHAPALSSPSDPNRQEVIDVCWSTNPGPDSAVEIYAYSKYIGRTAEIDCVRLARGDINDLIRLLRKVRDKTFGVDA